MNSTTIRISTSSNPAPPLQNHIFSLEKRGFGDDSGDSLARLTRVQGSARDDAACASMHVYGRAGKPKQLAQYAKNPGKTMVFERRGQEPNFLRFFQYFLEVRKVLRENSVQSTRKLLTVAISTPSMVRTASRPSLTSGKMASLVPES